MMIAVRYTVAPVCACSYRKTESNSKFARPIGRGIIL
ncbi:hypothetical protein HNQ80_002030 [Anaerosolibacter carboniphilus]|uniref:Uncharacterized protein n=1 Tax=Anaerosolibacter carboniphilus TaxID=1417629 RepID=A0A841L0M4_9FIRM|nr:hypothetical protein [Anaerosolibacter carboniphilus]